MRRPLVSVVSYWTSARADVFGYKGILSTVTGGSVFFHPRFDATRDRARVNDEIKRVLMRDIAYNVAVRIRCSNGELVRNTPDSELISGVRAART